MSKINYILFDTKNNFYYKHKKDNHWVNEIKQSSKFHEIEKIYKLINGFKYIENNIDNMVILAVDIDNNYKIIDNIQIKKETKAEPNNYKKINNETLNEIIYLINQLNKYDERDLEAVYNYCNKVVSYNDQIKSDILHKIEFDRISPLLAIKLIRQLKKASKNRRVAKNHLEIIQSIQNSQLLASTKIIQKQYDKQKNKIYKPRILTNLFRR